MFYVVCKYLISDFGDAFAAIGVREPQPRASEAFSRFGDYHRQMEKFGIDTLRAIKPVILFPFILYVLNLV